MVGLCLNERDTQRLGFVGMECNAIRRFIKSTRFVGLRFCDIKEDLIAADHNALTVLMFLTLTVIT